MVLGRPSFVTSLPARSQGTLRATLPLLAWAALLLVLLLVPEVLSGQEGDRVVRGSLRPYWHVFISFAALWVGLAAWILSISRRMARLERAEPEGA